MHDVKIPVSGKVEIIMGFDRTERVSEEIKRELVPIIRSLKDPRIPEFTSVVSVDVTRDFKYAKVYVSVMGGNKNAAVEGLNSAKGFIRREIGRQLTIRYIPEFTFVLDTSIEYGAHIAQVLADIDKKDKNN